MDVAALVFLSTGGASEPDGDQTVKWTRNGAFLPGGILQLAGERVRAGRKRAGAEVDVRAAHDRRDRCATVERDAERRRGLAGHECRSRSRTLTVEPSAGVEETTRGAVLSTRIAGDDVGRGVAEGVGDRRAEVVDAVRQQSTC